MISIHPELAAARIREGVRRAPEGDVAVCQVPLPDHFAVEIRYRSHARAFRYGFFPGATQVDAFTVRLETDRYFDVPRFFDVCGVGRTQAAGSSKITGSAA